jgi:hypothetical protein
MSWATAYAAHHATPSRPANCDDDDMPQAPGGPTPTARPPPTPTALSCEDVEDDMPQAPGGPTPKARPHTLAMPTAPSWADRYAKTVQPQLPVTTLPVTILDYYVYFFG